MLSSPEGKSDPCEQRESTGRVLIVTAIETRTREPTREERETYDKRERREERHVRRGGDEKR